MTSYNSHQANIMVTTGTRTEKEQCQEKWSMFKQGYVA